MVMTHEKLIKIVEIKYAVSLRASSVDNKQWIFVAFRKIQSRSRDLGVHNDREKSISVVSERNI